MGLPPCLFCRLFARWATRRTAARASGPGSALGSGPAMERQRSTPPSTPEEELTPVPALPALEPRTVPVRELLASLRAQEVTAEDVDAFLDSLEAPYLPGESPRERADLMLDTLEDERLCALTGSDGRRVGLAALETLLRLGHPYVFDVTPEMLTRARGAARSWWPSRAHAGLGLTGVNVLLLGVLFGPGYVDYSGGCQLANCADFEWEDLFSGPEKHLPVIVLMVLVPPVLALLARRRSSDNVQLFLTALQVAVGLVCLYMAFAGGAGFWLTEGLVLPALLPGVLSLLTAWCLFPDETPRP